MVPLAERCSEFQNLNDALKDQLVDMQHQMTISRDKLKRARLSLQNEKEESKRLRLAFDRQRIAKEGEVTEKKEMQAQLDSKDMEVSFFNLFSSLLSQHPPSFSDYFLNFQIKLLEKKLRALSKKLKVKSTRDGEDSDSSFQVVSKPVRI